MLFAPERGGGVSSRLEFLPERLRIVQELSLGPFGMGRRCTLRFVGSKAQGQVKMFYARRQNMVAKPSQHVARCGGDITGRIHYNGAQSGTISASLFH